MQSPSLRLALIPSQDQNNISLKFQSILSLSDMELQLQNTNISSVCLFSDQAFFMIDESKDYQDMSRLMQELLAFIRNEKDVFYRINELKDEIVHFKDVTNH